LKPFKTHRQQVTILRDRGLSIDGSKAMRVFEQENYYNVINGYKEFFLQTDASGNILNPEVYKPGATFDELYMLFNLDRELRNCIFEFLLKFETSLKSKISYRFSEKHQDAHAYLIHKNYTRDPSKLKTVLGLISTLSSIINQKSKTKTIGHYLDRHEGVPMWVLVNYLTIGNINFLYQCLTDSLKNKVAKDFADSFKRGYGTSLHFTPEMLYDIIKTTNFFRNVCAHEERLYNFKLTSPSRSADIASALAIPITELDQGNLFSMISFLKLGLTKKEHKLLIRKLKGILTSYSTNFSTANFNDILAKMGFEPNWDSYFI
jgi:abortive infection bacteriophage resistance protein